MIHLRCRRALVCPRFTVMAAEAGIRSGATLSGLLYSLLILLSGVFPDATESADPGVARLNTSEAIVRLSHVFGLSKVPTHTHHRSPPEYMVNLYHSVAFSDGITKTAPPFGADVVRGFPDKASTHQMHFKYNVSYVGEMEKVLQAEFHVYRLRQRARYRRRQRAVHVTVIRLYRILSGDQDIYHPDNLQIIHVRRLSVHDHGWQKFQVTDTVKQWVNDSSTNHGFLLTATSLQGDSVNGTFVRFAQRHEHHDSKQPLLLVFTEDQEYRLRRVMGEDLQGVADSNRRKYVQFMNEDYRAKFGPMPYQGVRYMTPKMHKELIREGGSTSAGGRRRVKRSESDYNYKSYGKRKRKACHRQQLYVDFVKIGWSGWIISPKGFNAYHCKGACPFPLGQNQKPTNHATVQSIVHALRIDSEVAQPCCVPNKLFPISLLYFDDDENVILKQYDDMVASSCGCH